MARSLPLIRDEPLVNLISEFISLVITQDKVVVPSFGGP